MVSRRPPKFLEGGEGNETASAKDGARHPTNQVQLGPLLLRRQLVSLHRGGETALWAEREALQGNDAGCLADAPPELFLVLQPRSLGRNQPQDDDPVLGNLAKRFEVTRARVVVLQQVAIEPGPAQHPGDRAVG